MIRWLTWLLIALNLPNLIGCGKQALPLGCTEADYAALAATCPNEEECNAKVDALQTRCAKKIEAE